jgi:hypothetical protein
MCSFDVFGLRTFISAIEKNYELVSDLTEINTVTGTEVDLQLHNAFSDWLTMPKVSKLNPPDSCINFISSRPIFERAKPLAKRIFTVLRLIVLNFSLLRFHRTIVGYKLQIVKPALVNDSAMSKKG